MEIILVIYAAVGYWAAGKTIYANVIRIGTMQNLFFRRLAAGIFLGWILIPIALIKSLFQH